MIEMHVHVAPLRFHWLIHEKIDPNPAFSLHALKGFQRTRICSGMVDSVLSLILRPVSTVLFLAQSPLIMASGCHSTRIKDNGR